MRGKREMLATASWVTGLTALCELWRKRRAIIVLNYHRIGNPNETQYDPLVFSATANEFEWQLGYLKRHFDIATLDDVVAMATGNKPLRAAVLITFDDGYRDNYTLAFPRLRAAGVPATFFLPTAFIGSDRLPWWDLIAYILKHARRNPIRLSYPFPVQLDTEKQGLKTAIAVALRAYKNPAMKDHDRFIAELLKSSDSVLPSPSAETCFMNWQEAREMQAGGMAFGSHTHNHEILTKLPVESQREELEVSRQILERELNRSIATLAYPVGGAQSFSVETQMAAMRSGYVAAFSFYGGFNLQANVHPFDIRRFGVEQQTRPRLRLQMALGAASGTLWL